MKVKMRFFNGPHKSSSLFSFNNMVYVVREQVCEVERVREMQSGTIVYE